MASDHGLSYQDTAEILARLGPLTQRIVLIGGQAVHFWVDRYAARIPELSQGVYTSKDVDFCGTSEDAKAAAEALGGEFILPTLDDLTPNTGVVEFPLGGGQERIDFLDQPFGVPREDARRTSLLVETGFNNTQFRVLNPLMCLRSRVCNTSLPGYTSVHALRQLHAALSCAREFLIDAIENAATNRAGGAFFRLAEQLFWLARGTRRAPQARRLFDDFQVDVFDAMPRQCRDPALESFYTLRLPQMLRQLQVERERRKRATSIRANEARRKRAR